MLTTRKAGDRGHSNLGWLNSFHTFSFGSYVDPRHMGFRALRVLNDDRVAPGQGFGAHGHRDMEILSYVLEGQLAHTDSMGERHVIGPREVQAMTAGSGIIHSEFNGSETDPVHFLQIWILPAQSDLEPSYQQIASPLDDKRGRLRLMAGPDGAQSAGAVSIHQDARMFGAVLRAGEQVSHRLAGGRHGWIHCASGSVDANGVSLEEGDGLAMSDEPLVTVQGTGPEGGEILLFDLA
jgi:redox-sensitive bicupin YhaK (pirin superfamily)